MILAQPSELKSVIKQLKKSDHQTIESAIGLFSLKNNEKSALKKAFVKNDSASAKETYWV
ncbi:hypothetical protein [Cohnella hashimotonis]|uniref:Uncharacterized protein n=1 Tax=Cohnella hashimotonis TaxID=2826895 RepID=A0ABT6TFW9_9BACL|nr:hypothetical protein [Cohnella hashimotonis]MDI4645739.1 hypothetical protein [Cohnella hashimotonis]